MIKTKAEVMKDVGKVRRNKITIQHIDGQVPNEHGDLVDTWVDLFATWAKVEINSGREFWASRKTNAEWTGIFKILYRQGIDTTMRVIYNGRIFEIKTVINPEEANRELWIEGKEKVV